MIVEIIVKNKSWKNKLKRTMMSSSIMMDDDLTNITNFEPTRRASRSITIKQFHSIDISSESEKLFLSDIPITNITVLGFVKKSQNISKGIRFTISDGTYHEPLTVLYFHKTDANTELNINIQEDLLVRVSGKISNTNDQRSLIAKSMSICNDSNSLTAHLAESLVINKWIEKEVTRDATSAFNEVESKILEFIKTNKSVLIDELIESVGLDKKIEVEESVRKLVDEKFVNFDNEDKTYSPGD